MPRPNKPKTPGERPVRAKRVSKSAPEPDLEQNQEPEVEVVEVIPPRRPSVVRPASASADCYVIDLLTKYGIDGRQDPDAERIPCGQTTGIDHVTEEIQARFVPIHGPGYYRRTRRENGNLIKHGVSVEYVSRPVYADPDDLESDEFETEESTDPRLIKLREQLRFERKLREIQEKAAQERARNGNGHSSENHVYEKLIDRLLNADPLDDIEKFQRILKGLRGQDNPSPPPAVAPANKRAALLDALSEEPAIVDSVTSNLSKTLFSSKDETSWAEVGMEAVKSGQAAQIVGTLAKEVMGPIMNLLRPNRQQQQQWNGPAPQWQPGQWQPGQGPPPQLHGPMPNAPPPVETQQPPEASEAPPPPGAPPGAIITGLSTVDEVTSAIVAIAKSGGAPADAAKVIKLAVFRNPGLADSVEELINLDVADIQDLLTVYDSDLPRVDNIKAWISELLKIVAREVDDE